MNDVQLKVYNLSSDANRSDIVVFQKNASALPGFTQESIAWKVIRNLGRNGYHSFTYQFNLQVSARDSFGNSSCPIDASPGDRFLYVEAASGHILQRDLTNRAGNPADIEIYNSLDMGSITADCLRSGKILATKQVVPKDKATFRFHPQIWIGTVSQIQEGAVISASVANQVQTNFDLTGLSMVSIVMSGGGQGQTAGPYTFTLDPSGADYC